MYHYTISYVTGGEYSHHRRGVKKGLLHFRNLPSHNRLPQSGRAPATAGLLPPGAPRPPQGDGVGMAWIPICRIATSFPIFPDLLHIGAYGLIPPLPPHC
ncbi:hypothetical protein I7I50_04982 [Histoplasma capsulatum G186AR]|uniref:Uncharacterized protein n=1 Tax=Ajellomyces capsulatus TaxID=5037 RepID=A0A8H7Z627_AJECA|nr:hypothetical protein I7I52_03240 [Histoplasma capsulatum]QSS75739.1 hypothetical protein I7I50_04982 [Histoplasma capsulatum G186AR]